jgi:hypothetical protein
VGRPRFELGSQGLTIPHRLSPAATLTVVCGLDHLFALDSTLGRAAYGL